MRHLAAATIGFCLIQSVYAHEGWGVVVHPRHGVVIADIPGNTIWRVADGHFEPLARAIHSHALVSPDGEAIYGSNPEPQRDVRSIWRIDASGHFSYVLPPSAHLSLSLQSFLIARDGSIYSTNPYDHGRPTILLIRRNAAGETVAVAGGPKGFRDGTAASARFNGIDGMAELADGSLLVADGAHLRRVTHDGRVSTVARALTIPSWGEDLLGISSPHHDTVYVADHAGRRILRVRVDGREVKEVDRSGLFWAPAGVEHSAGALYVLEHLRPPLSVLGDLQFGPYLRVRRLAAGRSVTLATLWGRHTMTAAVSTTLVIAIVSWVAVIARRRRKRAG